MCLEPRLSGDTVRNKAQVTPNVVPKILAKYWLKGSFGVFCNSLWKSPKDFLANPVLTRFPKPFSFPPSALVTVTSSGQPL